MHRDDGSYDFKRREDWDYSHGYKFMSGWLGTEEEVKEKKRKKKLGKVDMTAPPLPKDLKLVDSIEKTAKHVHKSDDSEVFERLIQQRNKGQPGWGFLEEKGDGYDYYRFCRHCCEREVDPRPLCDQARKVQEDRELKQINVKNNSFAAGLGVPEPTQKQLKDPSFKVGELMEVLGVKSKPDYNGKIVRVKGYDPHADRYEVKFEDGRYNGVLVKLREENLMFSSMTERDFKETDKILPSGEIPNGTKIHVYGLQNEAARWMNGQQGLIIQWDKDTERYELRLELDNSIKKVKPGNVKVQLPEGWEEHYDEHLGRHYYVNLKTDKVSWKHPTVTNQKGKMGKVTEKIDAFDGEDGEKIEVDVDRKQYDVDEEEEGEGGFNLMELVKKVDEQEERRLAAEDAAFEKGEEAPSDVDSDDGMHRVKKKAKKKKVNVTIEQLQHKIITLIEATCVDMELRATKKKDFSLLDGHFVAVKELDPVVEQFRASLDTGEEPTDEVMKATIEVMLSGLEKATALMTQLRVKKLMIGETNKVVDRITTNITPQQLFDDALWVSGLLKTM